MRNHWLRQVCGNGSIEFLSGGQNIREEADMIYFKNRLFMAFNFSAVFNLETFMMANEKAQPLNC